MYIVAKAPRAGAAKTRLVPALSHRQAADLAEAFLLDVVRLASDQPDVDVRAVCRDSRDARAIRGLVGPSIEILCQRQPGLGAALEECFTDGLAAGYSGVGVLAADNPTLAPKIVGQSFAALGESDLAIGRTRDGGYYLLTARAAHPTLFRDMVWSTDTVYAETVARCLSKGLRVAQLPEWHDIDTPADLERLVAELRVTPEHVAPHTRRALARFAATRG